MSSWSSDAQYSSGMRSVSPDRTFLSDAVIVRVLLPSRPLHSKHNSRFFPASSGPDRHRTANPRARLLYPLLHLAVVFPPKHGHDFSGLDSFIEGLLVEEGA